ncbi:MAG TPA: hypothetical protein VGR51_05400 [Thermoplasmata archaeon]|nr:hypothetical protein [Thermoplasmata archaeon]
MRFRFVIDGPQYTQHKAQFKRILADHRLKWKGNMTEFVWASGRERVRAEYERDEAKDVTVRATLLWEGKAKTPFLNELKTWAFSVDGKAVEEKRPGKPSESVKAHVEQELGFWDAVHKPDAAALRVAGRPEDWIARDLEAWKKARAVRKKELLAAQ